MLKTCTLSMLVGALGATGAIEIVTAAADRDFATYLCGCLGVACAARAFLTLSG